MMKNKNHKMEIRGFRRTEGLSQFTTIDNNPDINKIS